MKKCSNCKIVKPYSDFLKDKQKKDGHRFHCRDCLKLYYQKNRIEKLNKARTKKYGIDSKKFQEMKNAQNNACGICNLLFVPEKTPHVDHCHTTNNVRGLLCTHCNRGLGAFKDSISILQSAQEYI